MSYRILQPCSYVILCVHTQTLGIIVFIIQWCLFCLSLSVCVNSRITITTRTGSFGSVTKRRTSTGWRFRASSLTTRAPIRWWPGTGSVRPRLSSPYRLKHVLAQVSLSYLFFMFGSLLFRHHAGFFFFFFSRPSIKKKEVKENEGTNEEFYSNVKQVCLVFMVRKKACLT